MAGWPGGRRRARAPCWPCGPVPGRCPCPAGRPPSCARWRTAGRRASVPPRGRRRPRRGPGGRARPQRGRGGGSRPGSRSGWPGWGPDRRSGRCSWPRCCGLSRSSSPAGPPFAAASGPGTDQPTERRSCTRTPGSPARGPRRAGPRSGRQKPRGWARPPARPGRCRGPAGLGRPCTRRGSAGAARRRASIAASSSSACPPPCVGSSYVTVNVPGDRALAQAACGSRRTEYSVFPVRRSSMPSTSITTP